MHHYTKAATAIEIMGDLVSFPASVFCHLHNYSSQFFVIMLRRGNLEDVSHFKLIMKSVHVAEEGVDIKRKCSSIKEMLFVR